jgi:two-component system capsular synthesis sensor histidine kinase RcsC
MASPKITQSASPKRILVVDDGPEVAKAIRMALAVGAGYEVEIAENGEAALGRFKTSKFDLVITDLTMPNLDGLELAAAIKKLSPLQPIILITAYAESLKGDRERLANVDFVLEKPFSLQQLQDALARTFPLSQAS